MSTQQSLLPDAIYTALRESIIVQADLPGSIITEALVSARFGVARPTAKAAIERLVAEGLLHRETHKAARVPRLTRNDILDLFENRSIVETAAIARLTAIPAAALAAHRALLEAARTSAPFAQEDIAFHRSLVSGQPSRRLARMHDLLMGEIELCIGQVQAHQLLSASDVAKQHQGILDALVAGESALASALTAEHIAGSRDLLLHEFDRHHQEVTP